MSRFRRRLMGLAALRQAAADDFVRVEYIENTSTAYIDTNIQFNLSMEINGKFQNMDNTTSERDRRYFGCATTWKGYGLSVSENNIMLNEALSCDDGIKTYNVSTPFEIHYKNKSVTVNNYTVNLNTTKGNSTEVPTIYLLAEHRRNTAAISFLIGRLYYFKIYNENDVLVRDYIPMYQISTDTYGLWDRVEEKFYTSPNGTAFNGGRQIIYDAEIEYLEKGSGTSPFIDLGTSADAIFEITAQATRTINGSMTLITRHSLSNGGNWFGVPVVTNRCWGLGAASGTFSNVSSLKKTNITVDFTVNPVVGTINGNTFSRSRGTTNMTWHLFGTTYPFIGRLYSLKAYIGGKLAFDLIPVRVGNVGYMYDKVSGKLFGNNGRGSFILGQDTIVYDKI